jgi:MFS family permease
MKKSPAVRAAPSPGASSRRLMITLYAIAVFLYWIALYLYMPTLPTYAQSKSDNLALVGVVLSMYGLWQAIIRLPLGIAADWLGWRKPFIIVGLALAGLGAWAMGDHRPGYHRAGGRHLGTTGRCVQQPVSTPRGRMGQRYAHLRRLRRARAGYGRHGLAQRAGRISLGLLPGGRRCRAGHPHCAVHPGGTSPATTAFSGGHWQPDHPAGRAASLSARRPQPVRQLDGNWAQRMSRKAC